MTTTTATTTTTTTNKAGESQAKPPPDPTTTAPRACNQAMSAYLRRDEEPEVADVLAGGQVGVGVRDDAEHAAGAHALDVLQLQQT